jgi:hypothetical protein
LATARDKNGEVQTLKEVRDRKKLPYGSYYVYPNKKENSGGHGVNQALVLTPESYTLSRKAQVDYEKTEKNRLNYTEALMNGAKLTDVSLTLFDYKGGNAEEAEKFNEMQTLQLWYDEHDNHDKVDVVQYLYYRVEPICESYNTNYLLYTGMLNINFSGFTVQRANDYSPLGKAMGDAILSLVLLPTLPFVYGTNYVPTYYSFQFMQAINLQNEKQVMFKGLEIQHFRTDAVINNLIYDQLNELSAKPKYKKK